MARQQIAFVNSSLDGMGSYLLYRWLNPSNIIPYNDCNIKDFAKIIKAWLKKHNFDDYVVYIFGIGLNKMEYIKLIDHKNVVIFDNHASHADLKSNYKNARAIVTEYSSTCRLIYNALFKKKDVKLEDSRKLLISLIDDYTSFDHKHIQSYQLNLISFKIYKNNIAAFITRFNNGFIGFTKEEKNVIAENEVYVNNHIEDLKIYKGTIEFDEEKFEVVSTFSRIFITEVTKHLIDEYGAELVFIIDKDNNKIFFRKDREVVLDLGKFADAIADGYGYDYAASGKLTNTVIEYTKDLKPVI